MRPAAVPDQVSGAAGLAGRGRLLLVGGTFDPPHRAHVALAVAARDLLWHGDGWLVYVPAARSPLKPGPGWAAPGHRVEMLCRALAGVERACIWRWELDRPPPSYTIDTLRELRRGAGQTPARLLIGADQALRFHQWREPLEVAALAEPAVVPRSPWDDADAFAAGLRTLGVWDAEDVETWRRRFVPVRPCDASSTAVRDALRGGSGAAGALERMLDPCVLEYVRRHGLYA